MVAPREIELKLECEGSDLAELAAHPLLQAEAAARPSLLTSTYFDTADRRPARGGPDPAGPPRRRRRSSRP